MNKLKVYSDSKIVPEKPNFNTGDTVEVHIRIQEGGKERIQVFGGTVISMKNKQGQGMFTVRHLFQGQGVEKVFPFGAPSVEKVVVIRSGRIRRAKLFYLRDREGKGTRLREKH